MVGAGHGWGVLTAYELRNLPAHLAAVGRWSDLSAVLMDTQYLRAVRQELGLSGLAALLGGLDGVRLDPALREAVPELRQLVIAEASFLEMGQYAGYGGPFGNHLAAAAARRGQARLAGALTSRTSAVDQQGWLDVGTRGGSGAAEQVRYFMPGRRKSYGWDNIDAGPAGVETTIAVDLRRMRLLGQTISLYYDQSGYLPERYDWRIWDLRSGGLLFGRSVGVRTPDMNDYGARWEGHADWSAGGRPAAFTDPGLQWSIAGTPGRPDPPAADPVLTAAVAERSATARPLLACLNGPEWFYTENRRYVSVPSRCFLLGPGGQILADTFMGPGIDPQFLVRVEDRLLAFGPGEDKHVYGVDLTTGSPAGAEPALEGPEPPADLGWKWARREGRFEPRDGLQRAMPVRLDPPAALGYAATTYDFAESMFVVPGGQHVVEKRRLFVGVWEHPGGQWVGALSSRDQFSGGGGILTGCAVSPDGSRLITALGGFVLVWNLDELASKPPVRHPLGLNLPDWWLKEVDLPDPITHLDFLWGGWLAVVTTESHELLVLRFWASSAVMARIGLDEEVSDLRCEPYGDAIYCRGRSGRVTEYRFRYLPGWGVTGLEGDVLTVRLERPEATSVAVAGTFTGWERIPLERVDGCWQKAFRLGPGEHEYKFLVHGKDGQEWVVDPHLPFRPGPVGENTYLSVPHTLASAESAI